MHFHSYNKFIISEALEYHISNKLTITESIFRIGSESYINLIDEVKILHSEGKIVLQHDDELIVEKLKTGKKGVFKNKTVTLDLPQRCSDGKKKFQVYTDSGRKDSENRIIAKLIKWGDPLLKIKNNDPAAAKSFWARHRCDTKKDPTTAGFWACWAPTLFTKQIGLVSNRHW
jgi:hypothetical protein